MFLLNGEYGLVLCFLIMRNQSLVRHMLVIIIVATLALF